MGPSRRFVTVFAATLGLLLCAVAALSLRADPHAQFPAKWPDWREYEEVLPTRCDCRDCRLWRSGS